MRTVRGSSGLALVWLAVTTATAQTAGLVPLNDLGTGTYLGFAGGLYPMGANEPPLDHLERAMDAAVRIEPVDLAGTPAPDGAIVVLAIGMSNTNQEFAVFERQEDAGADRNARVVLVDGAVGGQDAVTLANPAAPYWTVVDNRLAALGLSAEQVQVVWLKEAVQGSVPAFPTDATELRDDLEAIVQILHDRFPDLLLCYLSSRIYGGYGSGGEPKAYDTGFAVKWLIEDQIDGDPALNDGRLVGPVEAPLLLWGPYLWANGPTPRSDGLVWLAGDIESDGTHPAPTGERKVADLLSAFFDAEPTALAWWPRRNAAGLLAVDAQADAHVEAANPSVNFGAAPRLAARGGAQPIRAYLGFSIPSLGSALEWAKLSLRIPTDGLGGGQVASVADTSWTELGITWNDAPPLGAVLANVPQSSRDGTFAADVTAALAAAVTLGLTTPATAGASYYSREAGAAPRLVLTIACAGGGPASLPDADGDGVRDPCDCAPADAGATGVPPEVSNLRWTATTRIVWDPVTPVAGSATVYDVMTGALAGVASAWPAPEDLCVASALTTNELEDATPPPSPGAGVYFLVRGRNACGAGRWATRTGGRDRIVAACL